MHWRGEEGVEDRGWGRERKKANLFLNSVNYVGTCTHEYFIVPHTIHTTLNTHYAHTPYNAELTKAMKN